MNRYDKRLLTMNNIIIPFMQVLTDWKLIIIVLAITGLTMLLLIIGEGIPFLRGTPMQVKDRESQRGRDVSFWQN